jgi:hypothetical protein
MELVGLVIKTPDHKGHKEQKVLLVFQDHLDQLEPKVLRELKERKDQKVK